MQNLERNFRGLGSSDKRVGHRRKRDAHATRRRASDAGKHGHADRFIDKNVGDRSKRVGDRNKTGQQRDHAPEPIF